ncbi:MAG: NADH-quinone oxidoreductase subunit NuoH [Deltaproteobacteria bacterium]|nr:MAG: NADH-quinone oxidoreductase subunit NuoH [Deltaproteobacteria bacterium]
MDFIANLPPHFFRIPVALTLVLTLVFVNALIMVYLERKIAGHMQYRLGPMEVGWHGLLQTAIDAVKLMSKQLIIPEASNRKLFRIAPLLAFTPSVLPFAVMPFAPKLQAIDLNIGIIFILAMASLNVMAIFVAGWSSNNKYSLLGAMRSVSQNIAYEIPVLLSLVSVVFVVNSFSLGDIVNYQGKIWFAVLQPLAFIIYFVSSVAETNRAPFDLPEAESELTAGFHTEYSGMGFALFFLGEYTEMFVVSSIATAVFLGGWHGFYLPFGEYSFVVWFLVKTYILMFLMIWFRWTFPRVRFDQLLNFSWKYLIPFSLVNLLITVVVVKI